MFRQTLSTSQGLTSQAMRTLRVRVRREVNYSFDNERKQYAKDMSTYRDGHREEFWNTQTQAENMWLAKFKEDQTRKQLNDLHRWRTRICTISNHTKKKLTYLEKKHADMLEKMRQKDLTNMRELTDKRLMLDAMEMQAERSWPSLLNLDEKINANVVIPQTVLDYGDYQKKLQNLAIYAEQADYKAMQEVLDSQNSIDVKNQLLQPLFRELKSQIRHMSSTPEAQIIKEYMVAREQLTIKNKLMQPKD